MGRGDTGSNALIGGAVAIATTVVLGPGSPVAGGVMAGYRQRGTSKDGAVVGALAGLVAVGLVFSLVLVSYVAGVNPHTNVDRVFLVGVSFLGTLAATMLGGFGGVLGVYVAIETDIGG